MTPPDVVKINTLDDYYETVIDPGPDEGVDPFALLLDKTKFLPHEARELAERLWHVIRRYNEARRFQDEHPEAYGHRRDN